MSRVVPIKGVEMSLAVQEARQSQRFADMLKDLAKSEKSTVGFQVEGVIKFFDVRKGYGFIVPDDGLPDVLLHLSCLQRAGYQIAHEGERIVVEVLSRPRGLKALRVISMDESTA